MALIKCEDCGKEVSDQAKSCPNCGRPICVTQEESKLIVYGLSQMLIGGKLKVYIDDEFVGEVKKGQSIEIPIVKDCTLSVRCGINPSRGKIEIKAGKTTKIKYEYNRLTGSFIPCVVDNVTNTFQ